MRNSTHIKAWVIHTSKLYVNRSNSRSRWRWRYVVDVVSEISSSIWNFQKILSDHMTSHVLLRDKRNVIRILRCNFSSKRDRKDQYISWFWSSRHARNLLEIYQFSLETYSRQFVTQRLRSSIYTFANVCFLINKRVDNNSWVTIWYFEKFETIIIRYRFSIAMMINIHEIYNSSFANHTKTTNLSNLFVLK